MSTHVESGVSGGSATTTPSHTLTDAPAQGSLLFAAVSLGNTSTFAAINNYALITNPNSYHATFWKVAGASEPAAQAPCTLGTARDWACAVTRINLAGAAVAVNVSGSTADATSPQDQAAIDPTDTIMAIMIGVATNDAARTYTLQTIGGVAATERIDATPTNGSVTVFDRLDVATGAATFAAQATASGVPANGAISLVIFRLQGPIVAAGGITPTGALRLVVQKSMAGVITPTGDLSLTRIFFLVTGGVIGLAGALGKSVNKTVAGAITPTGALSKLVSVSMAGGITPTGVLQRVFTRTMGGTIGLSGALTKVANKAFAGVVGLVGTLTFPMPPIGPRSSVRVVESGVRATLIENSGKTGAAVVTDGTTSVTVV